MDNKSLLSRSFAILGKNKWVWLITSLYSLSASLNFDRERIALDCIWGILRFLLILIMPLSLTITLYHSAIGESLSLHEIVTGTRRYLGKWIAVFFFVGLPLLLLVAAVWYLLRPFNFLVSQFIVSLLGGYFIWWYVAYLRLDILGTELGFVGRLKHAAALWARQRGIRILVVLSYSMSFLVFNAVMLMIQQGLSINTLRMSRQDQLKLPGFPLPIFLFVAVLTPIIEAITVATYFRITEGQRASQS